jgi:hypothetical protein
MNDEDFNSINPGESKLWVPPGQYPAQYLDFKTRLYRPWGEKLVFRWRIFIACDLSNSITLYRYYNLKRDGGGRFMFGDGHDYWKDWVAANNGKRPLNREKLPPSQFERRLFWVRVVTVTEDRDGPVCSALHSSRVGRLIRPFIEGEKFERLPLELPDSPEGRSSFTG